jgi:hypothetical protein
MAFNDYTNKKHTNLVVLEFILVCMCEQGIDKTIDHLGDMRNKEMK